MGLLIDGRWHDRWYDTDKNDGAFVRSDSQFRHWVTADGSAGPSGEAGFAAEADRYHLYVSLACPWAHRTLIFRRLKGLEPLIGVSVVDPYMGEQGWQFRSDRTGIGDKLYHQDYLHQLYTRDQADYSGRVTVPVLWDKRQRRIVSNESADIIRMFNSAFDLLTGNRDDYYPEDLREAIDAINQEVYERVNNGVYKAGFATEQTVYDQEVRHLFEALDKLEARLATQRYLAGERVTEADWRLFTTLVRFDSVYHGHFKCNLKTLREFPHLWGFTRELYQWPGVADTVDLEQIKLHYYRSHPTINPNGIVAAGPQLDLLAPHGRERL